MDFSTVKEKLEEAGVVFESGLTQREIQLTEESFGFNFPPDLKSFLMFALPSGRGWPSWRNVEDQMKTSLHSLETYLYKYLLPLVFVPWDGFQSLRVAFPANEPNAKNMLLLFVGFWLVLSPFVFWYGFRLKRVVLLDDRVLRVKGYLREIDIPLSNVQNVTERGWLGMRNVRLGLKMRSEFGDSIWFIPKGKLEALGRKSAVEELRERINVTH